MVVSARRSLKIGVEIMKKGGNAFDAMVAKLALQLPTLMQEILEVAVLWSIEKMEK
jgi:hypothetical protein